MNELAHNLDDDDETRSEIEGLHREVALLHQMLHRCNTTLSELHHAVSALQHELLPKPLPPNTQSYVHSLEQSTQALRTTVADLAKTLGLKPITIAGHRWVPEYSRSDSPIGLPDGDVVDALKLTVHTELREMFSEETLGRKQIRDYLENALTEHLDRIVRESVGLDRGSLRSNGLLAKELKERIEPLIAELIDANMDDIKTALKLPDIPDHLRKSAQDQFRNQMRSNIRDLVSGRAKELASVVLKDTIDTVVFEEMPWLADALRKHRTMEKLGHTERGAPRLEAGNYDD